MKKLSSVVLLFALICAPIAKGATASEESKSERVPVKSLLMNGFWDNWFISAGAGADVYLGQQDSKYGFGDRITPSFNINVGKWFTPVIGLRLGADYYGMRGLTTGNSFVYGQPYEKDGVLYHKQKFGFFTPHIDVMGDFSSLFCGYRANRVYSPILYLGGGAAIGTDLNEGSSLYLRLGFLNRFRLSKAWDLNLDINAGMVENNFDGDGGKRGDFIVGATLGVAYKFKEREWKAPVMPVVEPVMSKYSDQEGDALVAQLKDANNKIANLEQQLADAQKQQPVVVEQAEETPCATIYFSADRSDVTRKDLTILKALAKVMKANENTKYVVTGYADNKTGSASYNAKLREARAQKVYNVLVQNFGVNPKQLEKTTNDGNLNLFGSYTLDRAATIAPVK
ncbi:OmpA family protein [Barnesiella propionica]|uniref:OmpA family protein n=1 Tax=Barnesiella propionica TaxID=2981781 RepID=UPI0011CA239D|nr:OmpA family protein [Barnesiella propionica]MCU6768261.1 OmpA family protein [Barnesiella propionica]